MKENEVLNYALGAVFGLVAGVGLRQAMPTLGIAKSWGPAIGSALSFGGAAATDGEPVLLGMGFGSIAAYLLDLGGVLPA